MNKFYKAHGKTWQYHVEVSEPLKAKCKKINDDYHRNFKGANPPSGRFSCFQQQSVPVNCRKW